MPTATVKYIDTASSGGGTGNSEAHSGADAAYANAGSWEANEQANLVSLDETHTVNCSGSTVDTSYVAIGGWTVDATRFITFQANRSAADNDGFYGGSDLISTSHYRFQRGGSGLDLIGASAAYMVVDGIQIVVTGNVNNLEGIRCWQSTKGHVIKNCRLISERTTATGQVGLGDDGVAIGNGAWGTFDSNIIVGFNYGIKRNLQLTTTTYNIYNNTIYGSATTGIHIDNAGSAGGTCNIKNNLIFGSASSDDWSVDMTGLTVNADNNATEEDISADDSNWVDLSSYVAGDIFVSASVANSANFHLVNTGPATNAGISIGEATDADDLTRASPYDVGAFANFYATATAALSFLGLTISSAGEHQHEGTSAFSLGTTTLAASGSHHHEGTGAMSLGSVTLTAAGSNIGGLGVVVLNKFALGARALHGAALVTRNLVSNLISTLTRQQIITYED